MKESMKMAAYLKYSLTLVLLICVCACREEAQTPNETVEITETYIPPLPSQEEIEEIKDSFLAGMEIQAGEQMFAGQETSEDMDLIEDMDEIGRMEEDGELDMSLPVEDLSICDQWNQIWTSIADVEWSGSVQSCEPGQVNEEALDSVLALTNFYRGLANLPLVTLNMTSNSALQSCALMMEANQRLNHRPPEEWTCYDSGGAHMASQSNLAGSNAIDAVGMYMIDPGNETTMGHRRWIMSLGLETIGVGSSDSYSCMSVLHLHRPSGWVAFPPPGQMPIQAIEDRWGRSIDRTGWTIQYDGISLADAQISVTAYSLSEGEQDPQAMGESLPIEVVSLRLNYGSSAAYNMIPQGWRSEVGKRYVVKVESSNEVIEYTVEYVDCNE